MSIIRCNTAVASYFISSQVNVYTAQLIKTTNHSSFPQSITIDKNKTLLPANSEPDVVTQKLVNAIKLAEEKVESVI